VFFATSGDPAAQHRLRRAQSISQPLDDDAFISGLEAASGRTLMPAKPGLKPPEQQHRRPAMPLNAVTLTP
jgi:hypothetical protein